MIKLKMTLTEGDRDRDFWADMGPFFASPQVAKELGEPVTDEEGALWLVARCGGKVVGWSAFRIKADGVAQIDWSYVVWDLRQEGVWTQMQERVLEILRERGVARARTQTFDEDMRRALRRRGWKVRRTKGAWTFFEREIC